MTTRTTVTVVLLILLAAILAGLLFWNRLPDPMASHWGVNDQVDGYISRFWGVFLLPLMSLGMLVLFLAIPSIDPLKANITQFREIFNVFIVLIVAFMVYVYGLTLAWNLGYTGFKMSGAMLPAMGLLFIFVGFMMRRAKRNFFIGIRTPWTLSSDTVWDATHRLGAILFIISGVLAFIGGLFGGMASFWLVFVPVIGSTLILLVYSYVLYRREAKS
ncbi:MAG TPA: SdpI family protein [Anaerolineales bacterium]|nr:SdpI family protein [Anaerolineales bacterium]